jgi:hypothetical protein
VGGKSGDGHGGRPGGPPHLPGHYTGGPAPKPIWAKCPKTSS